MSTQLFVVERYDATGTAGRTLSWPAAPAGVRVVYAVRVPADDVVLALVQGADQETVAAALFEAGWCCDRITPAVRTRPGEDGPA